MHLTVLSLVKITASAIFIVTANSKKHLFIYLRFNIKLTTNANIKDALLF